MNFREFLATQKPIKDFSVEIELNSWDKMLIENKEGKKWSLQILQNFLGCRKEKSSPFPLKNFCEHYEEWKKDKIWHETIAFLERYNKEGGVIRKI
jgi:hypothetical protein